MSSVILEQSIIQAVISLSTFAARLEEDDVRDDIRNMVATLIRLCLSGQSDQDVRQWCISSLELLDTLASDEHIPQSSRSVAYVGVLRLQAALPAIKSSSAPAMKTVNKVMPARAVRTLHANEKKILQFIKEHPRVRTKELVERFDQTLSDRTIKRVLKELVARGSVRRIEQDNAVLYEVLDP